MSIYVFIAEGFEESEAIVPIDILRRAGADVQLVSVTGSKTVIGSHGIGVRTDITLDEISSDSCEAVILPGGSGGTAILAQSERVLSFVEEAASNGKYICAICAAPSILGSMGLLEGRKATCYPSFSKYLSSSIYTGSDIEKDDIFITAKAAGSSFEFAMKIVETLYGKQISEKIEKDIFY